VDRGQLKEERQYVIPAKLVLVKAGSRNPVSSVIPAKAGIYGINSSRNPELGVTNDKLLKKVIEFVKINQANNLNSIFHQRNYRAGENKNEKNSSPKIKNCRKGEKSANYAKSGPSFDFKGKIER